jgi:hypothetical protein
VLAALMEDTRKYFIRDNDPQYIAQFALSCLLATPDKLLCDAVQH